MSLTYFNECFDKSQIDYLIFFIFIDFFFNKLQKIEIQISSIS